MCISGFQTRNWLCSPEPASLSSVRAISIGTATLSLPPPIKPPLFPDLNTQIFNIHYSAILSSRSEPFTSPVCNSLPLSGMPILKLEVFFFISWHFFPYADAVLLATSWNFRSISMKKPCLLNWHSYCRNLLELEVRVDFEKTWSIGSSHVSLVIWFQWKYKDRWMGKITMI